MQTQTELYHLIREGRPDLPDDTINEWVRLLSQLKGCHLQSTIAQSQDQEAWLKARTKGIGGSEIACIAGKSPWSSAHQIWMKKTGQFDDINGGQQSEQARWGNLLETTIAQEWAHRNDRQYINIPVILASDEYPFMFANIDGFVLSDDGSTLEQILEIKTTSAYNQSVWEYGPIPEYYRCQTNWYCMITGMPCFTIVCLVGGQHMYDLGLPVDKGLCEELKAAAIEFWEVNVKQMIEPKMQAADMPELKAQADTVDTEDVEPTVLPDDESENLAEAYCNIRAKISALTKVQEAIKAQLLEKIVCTRQGITKTHTLTLSKQSRRSCDFDALEDLYPEAYSDCIKTNISSVFKVN